MMTTKLFDSPETAPVINDRFSLITIILLDLDQIEVLPQGTIFISISQSAISK